MSEYPDRFEVVAAFADGERVDTRALRAALAEEAGRDLLIDLVAMREIVRDAEGHETGGVTGAAVASSPAGVRTPGMSTPSRRVRQTARAMTARAALLALAVGLVGYAIGQQGSRVVPVAVLPPLEADVIVAVETPPAPTHVIHLGSGVPGNGGR